jgi:alkanesulfonate monooxygenase SsuD/methylene tetrahydromethanopterin reductase-like flavin-dependent oxidoreductase (luciferase family)
MRYALYLPNFGEFADGRALADLALEAEQAGWDGFFLWDHIQFGRGTLAADPWVALTAIAMRTERIRIGALMTPLPRRRPWKLARETATLDRLSGGRLIVGAGLGSDSFGEYGTFGEAVENKTHAAQLDEGLAVLTGLWSGQPFSYAGQHYTVRDALFLPPPIQSPRIPIWVAGIWPNIAPLRRAARWDGLCPIASGRTVSPEEVHEMLTSLMQQRTTDAPFDVAVAGSVGNRAPAEATQLLKAYADAGVTSWQEGFVPKDTLDDVHKRIHQGPPTF